MTGRRWIILTIATSVAVAGIAAAIAYAIDPYGVLRDPSGRKLSVYMYERKAKYLMSQRYVPANFDGLIIGASSTAVMDLPTLAGVRLYDESIPRGNATEEHILANQALIKGHYKLAIILLAPSMTSRHDVAEGLDSVMKTEAIASIHLFVHEAGYILHAAHIRFYKNRGSAAPDGQLVGLAPFPGVFNLRPLKAEDLQIDPVAIKDYRDLIQSLRSRGTTIVYLVPPLYEPYYQLNKQGFQTNLEAVLTQLPPAPVIDLSSPKYTALRSDRGNYEDCSHMNAKGSAKAAAILNQLVSEAMASGR
jgi:hypothetical protein